jgi:Ni/Fe-hydrogenase subunit HybB-like protein
VKKFLLILALVIWVCIFSAMALASSTNSVSPYTVTYNSQPIPLLIIYLICGLAGLVQVLVAFIYISGSKQAQLNHEDIKADVGKLFELADKKMDRDTHELLCKARTGHAHDEHGG